ncbi:AAA family ATPase [Myroides injenensis]|uniref:AAA family ATPase n=1 Tax=Myroides injenensis TaxID=1183151 RepID=UPI000289B1B5|nr:AAA family ATPase [Myroides injenensis]
MSSKIVFTGGPGSGKTTLLNALSEKGYSIVPEVGRAVIQCQIAKGGSALPWKDKQLFYQEMLNRSVEDYTIHNNGLTLWDRGIIDCIGYAYLEELLVEKQELELVKKYPYNKSVFILPPWESIYERDKERKQTYEEAIRTYEMMRKVYCQFGYQCIELPKVSIQERIDFVIKNIDL